MHEGGGAYSCLCDKRAVRAIRPITSRRGACLFPRGEGGVVMCSTASVDRLLTTCLRRAVRGGAEQWLVA